MEARQIVGNVGGSSPEVTHVFHTIGSWTAAGGGAYYQDIALPNAVDLDTTICEFVGENSLTAWPGFSWRFLDSQTVRIITHWAGGTGEVFHLMVTEGLSYVQHVTAPAISADDPTWQVPVSEIPNYGDGQEKIIVNGKGGAWASNDGTGADGQTYNIHNLRAISSVLLEGDYDHATGSNSTPHLQIYKY